MVKPYQMCSQCIMDTTDAEIVFDDKGVCNHCHEFERHGKANWFPNEEGARRLKEIVQMVKRYGQGKNYDSIIGLSGGTDSSYMALKIKEFGLRPLVVHVDAGWNSEIAVKNIEGIVKHCHYDLHTHVMNWEDMKQLQLAYLKSGIANQDVPQDHAFFASMYHFAVKNSIRYVLSGTNIATEGVFPKSWQNDAMDAINLKAIYKRFGDGKLKEYKTISFFSYYFYYPFIRKMKVIRPLDYMPYRREEAIKELEEKTGWKPYGRKHGESIFTRFFQDYYLMEKFGYDKRKPHLSSMILSVQLTREDALMELKEPLYDEKELRQDMLFVAKKLGFAVDEFERLMNGEKRHFSEFPSSYKMYVVMKKVQSLIEKYVGKIGGY